MSALPLNKLRDAPKVCIFGVGTLLQNCFSQVVLLLGRYPDYLCDNSQDKWGKAFFEVPCISPDELFKNSIEEDVLVIIAVKNYEAIDLQLQAGGISNAVFFSFDKAYNVIANISPIPRHNIVADTLDEFTGIPVRGKWALVTGASRGIGYQTAVAMAKMGANLVIHSRSLAHNEKVVRDCSKLGIEVVSLAAELSDAQELEGFLGEVDCCAPKIDFLFNSAGISPLAPPGFWDVHSDDYVKTYLINTVVPIKLCSHFLPSMIARGFGRVINVSSSIQHRPYEMAYACSKAALDKYVYDISPTLENTGVLISLLDPGWLKTDMGGQFAPHSVGSVVPGILLGALLDEYNNGQWFSAQDYTNYSIASAIQKFKFIVNQNT